MSHSSFPHVDTLLYLGSFDPPHFGHEAVIRHAQKVLQPKIIELLLLNNHVSGKLLSAPEHRQHMMEIFIAKQPIPVGINTIEVDLNLSGRTLETVKAIKKYQPDLELGILIGSDQAKYFHTWHNWQELLREAVCFVVPRIGHEMEQAELLAGMHLLPLPPKGIFATSLEIKQLLFEGKVEEAKLKTYPEIIEYLTQNHVYDPFFISHKNLFVPTVEPSH